LPKSVIEREIPGAGKLTAQQQKVISQASNGIVQTLGPQIQWVQSYIAGDQIYCVYIAPKRRDHSRARPRRPIPREPHREIRSIIEATTAESALNR
jgi:hypothetical protein